MRLYLSVCLSVCPLLCSVCDVLNNKCVRCELVCAECSFYFRILCVCLLCTGVFFGGTYFMCIYGWNHLHFLNGDRQTDGLTLCMPGKGVNCPIHSSASISKGDDGVLTAGNAPNELTWCGVLLFLWIFSAMFFLMRFSVKSNSLGPRFISFFWRRHMKCSQVVAS